MNVAALEKMLAKGNDSAMLRFGLGKAYLDDKNIDLAREHLQHCVDLDPDYSAAWNLLGTAYLQLGDKASAETVWQTGLEVAARNADKQTEKAITVFLKKLKK
jgi:Flp pilus assembly protein TadD